MTEDPSARPEATAPALPVRLISVFTSPGALFEKLAARPVWLDVLILLVVVNIVATMIVPEEMMRSAIETQLGPDATAEQIDAAMGITRSFGLVFAALGAPISIAVVAGLLILAYNVVMGGDATYRQLFSATSHGFIILVVGGLLTIFLAIARGGEAVVLSPALLIPGLGENYFARVLQRINVFAIWNCIVLGIAVSKIYPKRGAGGATAYLLVWYLLLIGVSALAGG